MATDAQATPDAQEDLLKSQLRRLRHSITKGPPYCQGTLSLPDSGLTLFYGKEDNTARVNLSTATDAQLQHLAETCQPATFGRDQQDVHDETYRKAGKLDKTDFLLAFDAERAGLLDTVQQELLVPRTREDSKIWAELYKLNVYGPGSFFKPHVDTPRSEAQFGSLVIVFPTAHDGGALAIRQHKGKGEEKETEEWTFDSTALFANCTERSIAYVAFFSDVEHEVLPVTSGYRVTITYNLYHKDKESIPPTPSAPKPVPTNEETFRTTLRALLDDPTFLPDGAVLLYGLYFKYPLQAHARASEGRKAITDLTGRLKACDAVVLKVAQDLGLPARLGVLYRSSGIWRSTPSLVFCDRVIPLSRQQLIDDPLSDTLTEHYGGELVIGRPSWRDIDKPRPKVQWITAAPAYTQEEERYVAYGNEATVKTTYWQIYLRLSVGPPGDRGGKPREIPPPELKGFGDD